MTEQVAAQLARKKRPDFSIKPRLLQIDVDRLSHIKRMLDEKVGILKVLDGELVEIVPEDELEEEIQRADKRGLRSSSQTRQGSEV